MNSSTTLQLLLHLAINLVMLVVMGSLFYSFYLASRLRTERKRVVSEWVPLE